MKPEQSKLRYQEREDSRQEHAVQSDQSPGLEFESVEEMIRYDREQTPTPEEVAERLHKSIAAEPAPAKPWYKRIFS